MKVILDKMKLFKGVSSLFHITQTPHTPVFSETRDINTPLLRDMKGTSPERSKPPEEKDNLPEQFAGPRIESCPYCSSNEIVKRGKRKTKYEVRQLYLCKACGRAFTSQKVKGHSYPLKVILDGISYYNIGYPLDKSCLFLKEKYGIDVKSSTLSDWIKEFEPLCRYSRLRQYGLKLFSPHQVIKSVRLYHRQVFDFRYHQAKIALVLQDFKHKRFQALRELLDAVSLECPHQLFKEGLRASECKVDFSLKEVMIREKHNFANRVAGLVLQAVSDNRKRHEALQWFMPANDSVTVACELPIYINDQDIEHMRENLGFIIPIELPEDKGYPVITGHIDIIQVRNGSIHIMDYKPKARKKKPIEQLTIYALALSRLTGLRLYDFKCAWFDENSYFEFFPLHVVSKRGGRREKVSKDQLTLPEVAQAV